LPEPQDLASEAITELEAVVDDLREIVALVEKEEGVEAWRIRSPRMDAYPRGRDFLSAWRWHAKSLKLVALEWPIPWLSSGDIKSDIVGEATETITEAGLAESCARLCRPGSVLVVVRSGILKHTLPVAITSRRAAINQDIKCFDSGNNDLNRWLVIVLRASERVLLAENREGTTV
jgi:hypothetical protein